jgi:hypothetical protein
MLIIHNLRVTDNIQYELFYMNEINYDKNK